MISTKFFVGLSILVAVVAAAEDNKCRKDLNIETTDFDGFKKDPTNPTEKMLCFLKCNYERAGAIKTDKTVKGDVVVKHIEEWRKLKDTTKTEIKECIDKLTTPINTCQDAKPYHLCVHNAVAKEISSTA